MSLGETSGAYILCPLVVLLLIREIYLIATVGNISHQKEGSWYPFAALPELLAVCLFAIPGLVPEKRDRAAREKIPEANEML